MDVVDSVDKALEQLDGHLNRFNTVTIIDFDGDTDTSSFSLKIKDLIRAAVLNQLETPHGLIGSDHEGFINSDFIGLNVSQDKDKLYFHVQRKEVKGGT